MWAAGKTWFTSQKERRPSVRTATGARLRLNFKVERGGNELVVGSEETRMGRSDPSRGRSRYIVQTRSLLILKQLFKALSQLYQGTPILGRRGMNLSRWSLLVWH